MFSKIIVSTINTSVVVKKNVVGVSKNFIFLGVHPYIYYLNYSRFLIA